MKSSRCHGEFIIALFMQRAVNPFYILPATVLTLSFFVNSVLKISESKKSYRGLPKIAGTSSV